MDPKKKRLLQRHYESIVKDLDVSDIQDRLYEKDYFSMEEYERIDSLNKAKRMDRTRDLLDNLLQTGTNSKYNIFVESLAKDYDWLWDKFHTEDTGPDLMNESFEDSLSKGDVPRPPDHYVTRTALESAVASKLKLLARHKILALHGMSGSGKTCVAISVLRGNPELITDNFNGVVFWLNLGDCKTDDDIIAQQTKLLRKTTSMYKPSLYMNPSISMSSIASNGDSLSSSNFDLNIQDLRDKLKIQFSETPLKESLLVLDEVNDRKCLEAFDIGCKILITTRDTDVVANYQTQIIKVENSLQKEESLKLFASFLDESVSRLPRQAKKLHEVCKGSPFHVALIGAQLAENKERLKDDPRHWDYYVKKLEKKEFSIFLTRPNDNPMKTIEVCINSLNDRILPLYKKLAILPDNVKVSAKVLSKLWNKEIVEVISIMQELKSKSLIIAIYDRERRNYMYEVHDLIMNYLKTCINDAEKRKLHDSFLDSYNYGNDSTPVDILDDGYIAFYVGFHILNTNNYNQKWSLFKKLFLDLKFLGNKVRLTGPADVILDLQKYETYIASDDLDKDLIYSIKAYLMTHGADIHRFQYTDLVQSILQHESKGILFTRASEVAQTNSRKKEVYFEFLHEQNVDGIKHSTIDVKEGITCVCFLGDYVLVGTQTGIIKFFHNPTNKLKKEYSDIDSSNGFPVKWLGVALARNQPIVAALFYNGALKLWNVDDLDQSDTEDIIEEEPEELQNNNQPSINVTIRTELGPIKNCRWSANEDFLITHTDHQVVIFSPLGDILSVIDNFDKCFLICCVPCNNDRYLAVAVVGRRQAVDIIDLNTKERIMSFEEDIDIVQVRDVLPLPGTNNILLLTQTEIIQYSFVVNKGNSTWKSADIIKSDDVKADLKFISFVVNKTGTLMFVSTDDSRVICVDLKTRAHVLDLDNRRGNVVAMAVSDIQLWDELIPGYDVLLTGTGTKDTENTAKVWHLDTSYISQAMNKNGKVRLTTTFDVSFLNSSSPQTPSTPSHTAKEVLNSTPKRHQSFNHREPPRKVLVNSLSLDRHSLKPLNLKGICNNNDVSVEPLLAVIDDKNNIQVMRGKKVLTEISEKFDDLITTVRITPCNQHIIYGLHSGNVKKHTLRSKETHIIMDVYSPVQFSKFVNPHLLIVAGKNRCIMAYRLTEYGNWETGMLQKGNTFLGSQEILNDLQGVKKKNVPDNLSSSESHCSLDLRDRTFSNGDKKGHLNKDSGLVDCFWVDRGLITIENNAAIKLWNQELKLACVLHARQLDVNITCAAFRKNVLVICDSHTLAFQTFQLKNRTQLELCTIQEQKLNNVITCCDLTADGNLLAIGLDSGDVLIWNVRGQRQIPHGLLRHHKNKVLACSFSPVPDRLYRNSAHQSPFVPPNTVEDDQPPLVLVTMATEIVWWNITYNMKMGWNGKYGRPSINALTPLASPLEHRLEVPQSTDQPNASPSQNFFFSDGFINQHCWKDTWKGKTCKLGSKRKEILACIKLSGIYAKTLCHDEKFSCFVTVDNTGHTHIMNLMTDGCS